VWLRSRAGGKCVNGLEELAGLASLADVVLDAEVFVLTATRYGIRSRCLLSAGSNVRIRWNTEANRPPD
jgi:hypothetical protein